MAGNVTGNVELGRGKNQRSASELLDYRMNKNVPNTSDLLSELLWKWEQSVNNGVPIAPETLCRENPELIDQLEREIRRLQEFDRFMFGNDVIHGNTSAVLLAFDEILSNGFDAHHFITGLANHLRDLRCAVAHRTKELHDNLVGHRDSLHRPRRTLHSLSNTTCRIERPCPATKIATWRE